MRNAVYREKLVSDFLGTWGWKEWLYLATCSRALQCALQLPHKLRTRTGKAVLGFGAPQIVACAESSALVNSQKVRGRACLHGGTLAVSAGTRFLQVLHTLTETLRCESESPGARDDDRGVNLLTELTLEGCASLRVLLRRLPEAFRRS
jgi:hypothetical protein